MSGLGVNIDHVATIRQARRTVEPDPVWAAAESQLGGADCITFHLRKDRRHINDRDAALLKHVVTCKLNMEMSLDQEIVDIALELRATQATLVPESREEITTEGGLDVITHFERIKEVVKKLQDVGTQVSAFIDPVTDQISASKDAGFDAMEIHTGQYANAVLPPNGLLADPAEVEKTIKEIREGLKVGLEHDLMVHAGHGLTYTNVQPIAAMPGFCEFNIGHSIISRAVFTGLREAVAEMKTLISTAIEE